LISPLKHSTYLLATANLLPLTGIRQIIPLINHCNDENSNISCTMAENNMILLYQGHGIYFQIVLLQQNALLDITA
jgi:hypothetical protein